MVLYTPISFLQRVYGILMVKYFIRKRGTMRKPSDVMDAVEGIRLLQADPVAAHAAEDNLYYQLINSIANGTMEQLQTACKIALKSQNVKFRRSFQSDEYER
jgi:hypothetical protein